MNFKELDLIFILSGGVIKDKSGIWRTTNYNEEGDKSGVLGDRMRIIAGSYLASDFPSAAIIVSGGKGSQTIDPSAPVLSEVMKRELVELGVPEDRVVRDNDSNSSFEQLKSLIHFMNDNNYMSAAVVSNDYHLPRLQAMVSYFSELDDLKEKNIEFISAENVVIDHNSNDYKKIIEDAYTSEDMKARIAQEQQGVKQIKDGTYRVS